LLPKADRSRSDQRRYVQTDVDQLNVVQRCRELGFTTKQVGSLLALPNGSVSDCQISKDIALKRIDDISSKIADQLALEQELKVVIGTCDATCGGQQNQVRGAFAQMQTPLTDKDTQCCNPSWVHKHWLSRPTVPRYQADIGPSPLPSAN